MADEDEEEEAYEEEEEEEEEGGVGPVVVAEVRRIRCIIAWSSGADTRAWSRTNKGTLLSQSDCDCTLQGGGGGKD